MATPVLPANGANRIRLAVSLFYFGQGIAFSSWASRIPDIKQSLHLSDALFGSILFALPLGQLFTMPVSGRLVTKYGSQKILTAAAPCYVFALVFLGFSSSAWHLVLSLFLFGVIGNMCNISVNTQGIEAEKMFEKPIMSTFHGVWSLAGFTGALIGLAMINLNLSPIIHFEIVTAMICINVLLNYKYLVQGTSAAGSSGSFFVRPEKTLFQLGLIGFCSMSAEGAMFDWSGIYFKDIVNAPSSLVVLGYASFMIMMALGRFAGDKIITKIGRKRTVQYSGLTVFTGMSISVLFPQLVPATLGFMLVGLGVSCIVPTVYSAAGKNKKVSPGMALAMVASVSYFGFLMGPPLIGYISEMLNLRYSYAIIGCFGLLVAVLSAKIKALD
jgi:MFS family permease